MLCGKGFVFPLNRAQRQKNTQSGCPGLKLVALVFGEKCPERKRETYETHKAMREVFLLLTAMLNPALTTMVIEEQKYTKAKQKMPLAMGKTQTQKERL